MKTFSLTGAAWSAEFWGAACAAGFCGGEDSVGFAGVDFGREPGAAGASGSCCAVANAPAISRTHAPRTKKNRDNCMMKLNESISPGDQRSATTPAQPSLRQPVCPSRIGHGDPESRTCG